MSKLKALILAIFQMALYFACVIGISIAYGALRRGALSASGGPTERDLLLSYAISCVVTVLVFLTIYRATNRSLTAYLPLRRVSMSQLSRFFLVGVGLNFATTIVMELLPIPPAVIADYEEYVESSALLGDVSALGILSTVLLGPLVEELVFRAGILNTLRRGRVPLALLIQTAVFAAIHMNPYQVIYAIPGGIVLGLVYLWTDSFLAPLSVHIAYNGLSAAFAYFQPGLRTDQSQQAYLLVIIASVTGMVHALRSLYRERAGQISGRFDKTV